MSARKFVVTLTGPQFDAVWTALDKEIIELTDQSEARHPGDASQRLATACRARDALRDAYHAATTSKRSTR